MDDAWQSQEMSPSNAGGALTSPHQDIHMSNGSGNTNAADDSTWQSGGAGDAPARERSKSPNAREQGGRGERGRDNRDGASTNPGNNLHVSGLGTDVTDVELETLFATAGRVQKVAIMYDPHTRDSRGFAFVTMETGEEADAAISKFNATPQFKSGKTLSVEKARRARARTPTPGRYYGPPKRGDERPYDPRPYDSRYSRDYRDDRDRRGRYEDRDRYHDRREDRRYDDRRHDDRRYEGRYDDRRNGDRRDYGRDRYGDYRGYDRTYNDRR